MMKEKKNKATASRHERRVVPGEVAGVMETTLPDVPADFMFRQLRDLKFFGDAVEDIQSIERYDGIPTLVYNVAERASSSARNNREKRTSLAQAGHCYRHKRIFGGKAVEIRSQFTRVDDEYNVENKKTFITVCCFLHSIATSIHVIEQLPPGQLLQYPPTTNKSRSTSSSSEPSTCSSSNSGSVSTSDVLCIDKDNRNAGGGCRWTLSYAMVPDGWRGRLLFWRRGKRRLQKQVHEATLDEFDQLTKAVQARYQSTIGTSSTSSNEVPSSTVAVMACAK